MIANAAQNSHYALSGPGELIADALYIRGVRVRVLTCLPLCGGLGPALCGGS